MSTLQNQQGTTTTSTTTTKTTIKETKLHGLCTKAWLKGLPYLLIGIELFHDLLSLYLGAFESI